MLLGFSFGGGGRRLVWYLGRNGLVVVVVAVADEVEAETGTGAGARLLAMACFAGE